jgi:AraC family transcriptional regulator, regulatory protein of adaptative response / methylated-DNA-[protein]-cysteine methyltransferase
MEVRVMSRSDEMYWQAVVKRDKTFDGQFVFAVKSTHIYCRPSCTSRKPRRENVTFFQLPAAAEEAGYRACKRCKPQTAEIVDAHIALVQEVCEYIAANLETPDALTLQALGETFHFAPEYLQKTFKSLMGISPHQYEESLRVAQLKDELRAAPDVASAIYGAGFRSSSQVYENSDRYLGMTPAVYRKEGQGMTIRFAVLESYLGVLLIGTTERGVCAVGIYDSVEAGVDALHNEYPRAELLPDEKDLGDTLAAILGYIDGYQPAPDLPLDIQATAFQWRVWGALQRIPRGETRTYAEIAAEIGQPSAVRAVARACSSNRAAVVIPCHRVIGKDGTLTGYRWGIERKEILLKREQA